MAEFIFTSILMVALSLVLYLTVRALPRIAEESVAADHKSFIDRWGHSHIPEQVDRMLNTFLFKFFRKAKVYTLKIDNSLSKQIQKVKTEEKENEKKAAIDFKEIAGQNKEGKE